MVKLSNEEIVLVNAFENATGARANDVITTSDSIVFLVKAGDLGRAIGKNGVNLERLRASLGRNVDVFEDSNELKRFLANVFYGIAFQGVEEKEIAGKKTVLLKVDARQKGLAIGKRGGKINCARTLLKRRFGFDDLKIL